MKVPAYRRYMMDKIRRYHTSYLGWISNYNDSDREVLAGAAELQKAFGYRFVLDSASYPLAVQPGKKLTVKLSVRNTGSAPFYLDWPVAVGAARSRDEEARLVGSVERCGHSKVAAGRGLGQRGLRLSPPRRPVS